uniref:PX domain-containing protein n=1 Tax=Calcidiscus leptoporus TaxID=127549 RepID=A0A7S0IK38_9EUKA|mmetsp:Transcript_117/g.248  ORF Transcript_117/g.248 Transcript_117/m.248 type:complete len:338 (+) Transcript_117:65-1078(+)|eukprot:CAMPEP_0119402530 /NCGR_PEP_ID=MMETSP1334-20130426/142922_1 /TAXON_ID=127549 /ORGANISM="Calcidiscus leptoporus, Strain RCC1130" /LENGTH=337 /DNA_ID=CAMNT_0007426463 /DNA_START=65 /DNA_END=1078 /DNA_ORIENTATION=+
MPSSVHVDVPTFRLSENHGDTFAVYVIDVSEGDESWSVVRRWNDIKEMMQDMHELHTKELRAAKIPKFEPHGWRWGPSALDPAFLNQRKAALQKLLKALVAEFGVSFARQAGPAPVRELLDQEVPEPGVRATMNGTAYADEIASPEPAAAPLSSPLELSPPAAAIAERKSVAEDGIGGTGGETEPTHSTGRPDGEGAGESAVEAAVDAVDAVANTQTAEPSAASGSLPAAAPEALPQLPAAPPATSALSATAPTAETQRRPPPPASMLDTVKTLPDEDDQFDDALEPEDDLDVAKTGAEQDADDNIGVAALVLWISVILVPFVALLAKELIGFHLIR